jgi:hypothetical protein
MYLLPESPFRLQVGCPTRGFATSLPKCLMSNGQRINGSSRRGWSSDSSTSIWGSRSMPERSEGRKG